MATNRENPHEELPLINCIHKIVVYETKSVSSMFFNCRYMFCLLCDNIVVTDSCQVLAKLNLSVKTGRVRGSQILMSEVNVLCRRVHLAIGINHLNVQFSENDVNNTNQSIVK